ncbi:MAG: hypothetical protein AMJ41_04020 [candidate division Zixibacteria bacterium DG_27]|nr:MAG: hypothetical protein AMJ41_04020 [candidate division Zixibacteria bacterium DG_27]
MKNLIPDWIFSPAEAGIGDEAIEYLATETLLNLDILRKPGELELSPEVVERRETGLKERAEKDPFEFLRPELVSSYRQDLGVSCFRISSFLQKRYDSLSRKQPVLGVGVPAPLTQSYGEIVNRIRAIKLFEPGDAVGGVSLRPVKGYVEELKSVEEQIPLELCLRLSCLFGLEAVLFLAGLTSLDGRHFRSAAIVRLGHCFWEYQQKELAKVCFYEIASHPERIDNPKLAFHYVSANLWLYVIFSKELKFPVMEKHLSEAARFDPDNLMLLYNSFELELLRNDIGKAFEFLENLLKRDKEFLISSLKVDEPLKELIYENPEVYQRLEREGVLD